MGWSVELGEWPEFGLWFRVSEAGFTGVGGCVCMGYGPVSNCWGSTGVAVVVVGGDGVSAVVGVGTDFGVGTVVVVADAIVAFVVASGAAVAAGVGMLCCLSLLMVVSWSVPKLAGEYKLFLMSFAMIRIPYSL